MASFDPNAFGRFDISGDAWESVADWFAAYPNTPRMDLIGPETGKLRIMRGGSWLSPLANLRCDTRSPRKPTYGSAAAGSGRVPSRRGSPGPSST